MPFQKANTYDFSLKDVCWGYRDIFDTCIQRLYNDGMLGEHNRTVTTRLFGFLSKADKACYDHVLKEFLCALNPKNYWIMNLPGIFADIVKLGGEFAESKISNAIEYFKILHDNGFGRNPSEVQNCIGFLRQLKNIDDELAIAFLAGYPHLIQRLEPGEIVRYLENGINVYETNSHAGINYMRTSTTSAENTILSLTRECRIEDVRVLLSHLMCALVGYEIEIRDIGELDSDLLIERGTATVCMYKWFYCPARIRSFPSARSNREWYLLLGIMAAGMLSADSFSTFHGHRGYSTCSDLVGNTTFKQNLFLIIEIVRVINTIRTRWPGAGKLIDMGIHHEFTSFPPVSPADRLCYDVLCAGSTPPRRVQAILDQAHLCSDCFDTAHCVEREWADSFRTHSPGLADAPLRVFSFIPDFLYPGTTTVPSEKSHAGYEPGNRTRKNVEPRGQKGQHFVLQREGTGASTENRDSDMSKESMSPASFLYDEWNHTANDYYRNYCSIHEIIPEISSRDPRRITSTDEIRRIQKVFERCRPDRARRQKYLSTGDSINPDLLLKYLVLRHRHPDPKINFYEKPLKKERDFSVLLLLDISGSTADRGKDIIFTPLSP
jgi:hypothetical protein